jgi:hypothetical protein
MDKRKYKVMAAAGHNAKLEMTDLADKPISNEIATTDALVLYSMIRDEIPWPTFGALVNYIIKMHPDGYK